MVQHTAGGASAADPASAGGHHSDGRPPLPPGGHHAHGGEAGVPPYASAASGAFESVGEGGHEQWCTPGPSTSNSGYDCPCRAAPRTYLTEPPADPKLAAQLEDCLGLFKRRIEEPCVRLVSAVDEKMAAAEWDNVCEGLKKVNAFLRERGVTLISAGLDEVPMVYKDIHEVMAAQNDLVTILGQFDPKLVKMAPHGERAED